MKDGQVERSRFSQENIIAVLRGIEAGAKAAVFSREHGVLSATLYNWESSYRSMDVSEVLRLKSLEDKSEVEEEGACGVDAAAFRELLSMNWQGPLPSAPLSRICRPSCIYPSGGLARLSGQIGRWFGIAHAVHLRRRGSNPVRMKVQWQVTLTQPPDPGRLIGDSVRLSFWLGVGGQGPLSGALA